MALRQKQIYWLTDCPPLDGDTDKDRPVIVFTPPEVLRTKPLVVNIVACTTHPKRNDPRQFRIPPRIEVADTGLPDECWALPRWRLPINPYRLTDLKGNCPDDVFLDLLIATLQQADILPP